MGRTLEQTKLRCKLLNQEIEWGSSPRTKHRKQHTWEVGKKSKEKQRMNPTVTKSISQLERRNSNREEILKEDLGDTFLKKSWKSSDWKDPSSAKQVKF